MATGASASHQDGHGVLEHFTRFQRMLCVFCAYHFLAVMALRSERTPRLNFEVAPFDARCRPKSVGEKRRRMSYDLFCQ